MSLRGRDGDMAGTDANARERADGDDGSAYGPSGYNRKRAALAVLPFLGLGIADVVLLLFWGLNPLWGFAILPPIVFCSVLTYIVFRSGMLDDRT